MMKDWLPTLEAATPQLGYELAIELARMGVKLTQPSDEVLGKLRASYEQDSQQLIAVSHVIATQFQTIAAANGYWRTLGGQIRWRASEKSR